MSQGGLMRRKLQQISRRMGIQMIISLSFTAVAVVGMLFIGMSLFLRFSAAAGELSADSGQRVLAQVNLNLDSYLRRMMRISDTVYYRLIKNTDLAEGSLDAGLDLLYEENLDSVVSIAVFDKEGALVSGAPLKTLKTACAPETQSWFTSARARIENFHFSVPHVQNLFVEQEASYHWVVSLSRQVELTWDGTTTDGVLLVDMSFDGIEQICKDVSLSNGGYVYLIDSTGEIIYHPRQQLIYAGLSEENNKKAATYGDGSTGETFQGEQRQITVKTVGYTGWKLVAVSPSGWETSGSQLLFFGISLLLFSAFLMAFVNNRLSAHISEPVRALDRAVKQLEAGGEEVSFDVGGSFEVKHLGHSIESMVSTMRHLMDDIIQQEDAKRRSELDVLQSQINPHFLYNTLDSVIWMTENGRTDEAVVMVSALARFFRISLSRGSSIITLSDELEHARNYLTIQNMRYKNKFTSTIRQDPGTESLYVLKLIVQPILENAIYYGVASSDGDGEIEIHAFRSGDDLYIDVRDNGLGMPQEMVDQLLDEHRPAVTTKGSGIGLRNVHRRIQLTFGLDYGLEITSELDEGTNVRIHLPALDDQAAAPYRGK